MTRRPPSDRDSPTLQPGLVPAVAGRGAAIGRGPARAPATSAAQDKAPAAPMLRDRLREVLERDRAMVEAARSFTHGFTQEESGTRMRLPKAKPRALDPDEIASIDALLSGDFEPTWPVAEHALPEHALPADVHAPAAEARAPLSHASSDSASAAVSPDEALPGCTLPSAPAQPSAAWQAARSWRGARQRSFEVRTPAPTTSPTRAPASVSRSHTEAARATLHSHAEAVHASTAGPLPPFALAPADEPPAAPAEPPALALFADWIAAEVSELAEPSPAPIVLTPELAPTLHTGTLASGAPEEGDEARFGKEPIRTRTMARLLAGHGYRSRALSIFDELLARRPADADLRAEAEALRRVPK